MQFFWHFLENLANKKYQQIPKAPFKMLLKHVLCLLGTFNNHLLFHFILCSLLQYILCYESFHLKSPFSGQKLITNFFWRCKEATTTVEWPTLLNILRQGNTVKFFLLEYFMEYSFRSIS